MVRGLLVPWRQLLGQVIARRKWEHRGTEPGQLLPATPHPCKMVITWAPGKKGIRVRCECMAEARRHAPRSASWKFYNYDHLADVSTLAEANRVWTEHVVSVEEG